MQIDSTALAHDATSLQQASVQRGANALKRKIQAWCDIQVIYCPAAATLRSRAEQSAGLNSPDEKPQNTKLWLPSDIGNKISFNLSLARIEWDLRYSQSHDTLDEIRQHLRLRSYLTKFKDAFVRGQGSNTRARDIVNRYNDKIDACATKYRVARKALVSLAALLAETTWQNVLLPMMPEDVRGMSEGLMDESEGHRTLSWIWKTLSVSASASEDERLQDGKCFIDSRNENDLISCN